MLRFQRTTWTDQAWRNGDLTWMLRPGGQVRFYEWVSRLPYGSDPICALIHRRFGKSFVACALLVERCLQRPHQFTRFGAPTFKQVEDIVMPHLSMILSTCPEELRPQHRDDKWIFRNPAWDEPGAQSEFQLVPCNYKKGEYLRGMACDEYALDEVRDIENLEYLVNDVLAPQFVGRDDPRGILITTMPKSLDHAFIQKVKPRAEAKGRYFLLSAADNPDWTEEDDRIVADGCGGRETTSYRREVYCEPVSDESALITPEAQRFKDELFVEGYQRPMYFCPYVVMDTGWVDFTAVLFCYVDFHNRKLVFEDEIVLHYRTLGEIAELVKAKEAELYGPHQPSRGPQGKPLWTEVRRRADMTELDLQSMGRDHKLYFLPVEKYELYENVAKFRDRLLLRQVRVLPAAKQLRHQLLHGIYNEKRTNFLRSDTMGHWDAGIAACYANRMVRWEENPYPPEYVDLSQTWLENGPPKKEDTRLKLVGGLRPAPFGRKPR